VRAYQDQYQPKLEALDLSLIEARALLVMNDLSGLNAEGLVVHLNAPVSEVQEALINLQERGLAQQRDQGYGLTDAGQLKSDQCWDLAASHADEAFKDFSDEQVNTFTDVLRGLIGK
jgi:predicted transcriptional regulator